MRSVLASSAALVAFAAKATAFLNRHISGMEVGPLVDDEDTDVLGVNGTNGWGTFDQLLDHSNPSLGTFKQRFWYGTAFWKGPGSPVFFVNPGEQEATGFNKTYTTNQRLAGRAAAETGGAVVILEHRYWGESSPFDVLTAKNLSWLTLEDSIKDNTYFANNFDAPWDPTGGSTPKKAPWIFSGGSYPGALAGWIATLDPGTFWAYHGTSGVVESVTNLDGYFEVIDKATPANCSADLHAVVDYVDSILLHGSEKKKQELKDSFQLGDLEDADFASTLAAGPGRWQSNQFYTGNNTYYQFCDYLEGVWPGSTNPVPGPEGVGRCQALKNYKKFILENVFPDPCAGYGYDDFNGPNNTLCLQSLNASNPIYHDLTVGNPGNRQWVWMLCNEPFEYWQTGAPEGKPSIISRLVSVDYYRAQCPFFFPEGTFGLAEGKTADTVNAYTGGWFNTNATRLMYANGQFDPWRPATVSADERPGGPLASTPELPVRIIEGGFHCSDLYGPNWAANEGVAALVTDEIANLKTWIADFYKEKKLVKEWMLQM